MSEVQQFRKKPVTISAVLWNGSNIDEVMDFVGYVAGRFNVTDGFRIVTLEGVMSASVGDWIIRGVNGEHYPCKPDIFALTHEPLPTPGAAHE